MTKLRLALLNAAHDGSESARNFRRELDATLVEYDATAGHLPPDFDFDGAVITGSRSSVYWDEEWIQSLVEWTREAADREMPILGVCYGHQVLAEALGGRVEDMGGFEIGYRRVEQTNPDELFDGIDEEFTVFTTHGDVVVELPPGAERLAENEYGIHAFRSGHTWGVQFHPEYDTETARSVAEGKREKLGDERIEDVLDGITPETYAAACEAKALFENFTQYARRMKTRATDVSDRGQETAQSR